ncbi:MAG: hypothetical protein B6D55_06300 [Candidatus Omnitrophica bacterium 4484_70.2]|nr:MAG: hypothetical protein B6D55_06300 [Candidatus Omnitrophica bacterium 4484_70.2]
MKRAKIKFVRIRAGMNKYVYQVLDWEGVASFLDLPVSYTNSEPCFYEDIKPGHRRIVVKTGKEIIILTPNLALSEEGFKKAITTMKKAGNRLSKILRDNRVKFTVEI